MLLRHFVGSIFSLMILCVGGVSGQITSTGSGQATSTSSGQAYPDRPVRIVTSGIGGGTDFVARLIALGIMGPLGQQVVVENRASGVQPSEVVARATPDGYTVLIQGQALWIGPLFQKLSYDPVKDFSPITLTDKSPSVLVVAPSVPVTSVKELIGLAKSKPGQLNYAANAAGSAAHLAAELFKSMAGVNIVWVPYKSMGSAVTDLISSQVQMMMSTPAAVTPHIKSGKVRALAIATAQPSALLPGLPTVAASGVPGYEAVSITGVFVPAKTPVAIVNRLNREIVRVVNTEDVKEKLFSTGSETVGSSPQELGAWVKSDMVKYGKVIKEAGIKLN